MAWDISAQILPSSVLTTSSQSTAIDPEGATAPSGIILFQAWVAVVTGTSPTLDLYIDESDDNSTFYEIAKFLPITVGSHLIAATKTTTNQYQAVGNRQRRYLRARWVTGGSATPTFNGVIVNARGLGVQVPAVPSAT